LYGNGGIMGSYEMMEKWINKFQKEWEQKLELLDETTRDVAKQIDKENNNRYSYNTMDNSPLVIKVKQDFIDSKMACPSEFMKKYYKDVVEIFVQPDNLSDFYTIIDHLNDYPFSRGMYRRTVRSRDYTTWFPTIFNLLKSYKMFQVCNCSIYDYLTGNLSKDIKEIISEYSWSYRLNFWDYMMAARFDTGDKEVEEFVTDMLLGDNNTAVVTTNIIRAIVMCHNEKLHQLLADFLLAARLQEGIRQAVCENADCGTISAFLVIFKTIYDNNLIRFAAVKRAVATWTGLCDLDHVDRITDKVLNVVHEAIESGTDKAIEFTKSNDSIQIMCGLWTLGFYDIQNAIDVMDEFIANGTKNQLLTMGYYNTYLYYQEYSYKTAYKVVMAYPQDYELIAVFMPSFLNNTSTLVYGAIGRGRRQDGEEEGYKGIAVTDLYPSKEEAYKCYQVMKEIYNQIPKKRKEFSPIIFPWYSACLTKTDLVIRMCATAYALSDISLMEEACTYLPDIDVSGYYTSRSAYLELLTHEPKSPALRHYLIQAIADKESSTRQKAFDMVSELQKEGLSAEEYIQLESFLKYKTSGIRKNVLALLNKQSYEGRIESAKRLLNGNVTELRMGGLTMLQDLQQNKEAMAQEDVKMMFDKALETLQEMSKITDSEQIIVDELLGQGKATEVLNEEGYGLYVPSQEVHMPKREEHPEVFQNYFAVSKSELDTAFDNLEEFYKKHSMLEYKNAAGVETLLSNNLSAINTDSNLPIEDRYPFKELWVEFYETYIKNPTLLFHMQMARKVLALDNIENKDAYDKHMKILLGSCLCDYFARLKNQKEYSNAHYGYDIDIIIRIMVSMYPDTKINNVAQEMLNYVVYQVEDSALWFKRIKDKKNYYSQNDSEVSLISNGRISSLVYLSWKTDEQFKKRFEIYYDIDRRFEYNKHKDSRYYYYGRDRSNSYLNIFDYIKAYTLGMIPKNEVYKAAFEYFSLSYTLSALSIFSLDKLLPYQETQIARYMKDDKVDKESDFYKNAVDIYEHIVNKVLDVELSRGDLPTIFSSAARSIQHFCGIERMVQILVAMGDEKLDRGTYYWGSNGDSKSVVLSHLLSVCYPKEGDDAKKLKVLLKDKKISEVRLYETIMYAPQWIDIIQEYLKKDLKTGCYYFMAHMNERFDDKKKAVIAKYTPLSAEELNNGAFDLNWFKSAYKTLGDATFQRLYDAAKYISDGNKHARARKYSDAALGKVTVSELEEKIKDKRNKDLLMSYGVIPIADEKDELRRYEFIQGFRKESRQFGAQRKASEGLACDMALRNLSTNAGYQDVTRLILAMETKMVENDSDAFKPHTIGEVSVRLVVDSYGKVSLECVKKGKTLKSLPTNLKKDEYVLYLKDIQKKLKEQYSRTVKMFEQAMEDREVYTFKELKNLTKNPVIEPIINNLVYITCGKTQKIGMLSNKGLIDYNDETASLKGDSKLRVAHPFDLYQAGCWSAYQDYLFTQMQAETRVKQPFKQVFRELYVKLSEENERFNSRMFAGNQIQPQKTVGCLKNRRWVADYEEGLQKVYYKDNIIAKIYALADWFSPSDIEAPTLEWVEFSDRNTFKPIKIGDVPDIVYSEIMRDVDLAVSVAHVGGVDPETSHSTMDMRKVIIAHNLALFRLTNVTFKDHHAIIKGQRAEYSIHLGSGVIHMLGSHQVYVLPVHSQSRGKIFLPFVDEDPKTAEIMSKIVLFAQDEKIKDPYILNQLK